MSRAKAPVAFAIAAALAGCSVFDDQPSFRLAVNPEHALSLDLIAANVEADFGGRAPAAQLEARLGEIANLMASGMGYDAETPFTLALLDDAEPMAFHIPGRKAFITRGMAALFTDDHDAAAAFGMVFAAPFGMDLTRLYAQPENAGVTALVRAFPEDTQIGTRVRRLIRPHLGGDGAADRAAAAQRVVSAMISRGFDPQGMVRFAASAQVAGDAFLTLTGGRPPLAPAAAFPLTAADAAAAVAAALEARETAIAAASQIVGDPQPVRLPTLMQGLAVGPGPQDAARRGGLIVHPGLGISVNAPPGTTAVSAPTALRLFTPAGARLLIEAFDGLPPTDHLAAYIRDRPGRALTVTGKLRDATEYRIGPFNAATAQTIIRTDAGGPGLSLSVLRRTRDARLYEVTGAWSAENERAGVEAAAMTSSIRIANGGGNPQAVIGAAEAPAAAGGALGAQTADWFAMINALPPGASPAPGAMVKTIVAR